MQYDSLEVMVRLEETDFKLEFPLRHDSSKVMDEWLVVRRMKG